MNIQVVIKNVYGKENIYVSDSELAEVIFNLTGSKTLQDRHIESLKKLGFTFTQVVEERRF